MTSFPDQQILQVSQKSLPLPRSLEDQGPTQKVKEVVSLCISLSQRQTSDLCAVFFSAKHRQLPSPDDPAV